MAETSPQGITGPRRTLGLVGITIHAMTLIAPGAFVWLLFPLQLSISKTDIWPGVLLALGAAFLTSLGFSSLAARYPEAGNYSAYHFVQRVFSDLNETEHAKWARPVKFLTGWSAHLFYWIYPGVMLAFMTTLVVYLLRQFGYHPTVFGEVILVLSLAGFIGFLGLRGIRGSMTSSILLNVIQIVIVALFSVLALVFRWMNPINVPPSAWLHPQLSDVVAPHEMQALLLQASVSIFLVIGFEAVVSLGVAAANPRRDIPRGTILSLLIQGLLAYSIQYFAFNAALPAAGSPIFSSPAPLGDLAILIGDHLLAGNGYTLMIIVAASVLIAGLAASLTSLNTGVRTTFAMALDDEMPEFLSLLHEEFATPSNAVIILAAVSAGVGILGTVGGTTALLGITLATNLGAFVLYAIVCVMTLVINIQQPGGSSGWSRVLAGLGLLINLGLAAVIVWSAFGMDGSTLQGARLALLIAVIWLAASAAYYWIVGKRKRAAISS
jgi:basic amino acid/polyamine antiporter, APA family